MGTAPVAAALAAAATLIAVTSAIGTQLRGISLHAAPLFGSVDVRLGPRVLLPVAVAALVVWQGPAMAQRLTWRRLLLAMFIGAVTWGVALAAVDVGARGLVRGVASGSDLLHGMTKISSPATFIDTFVERIGGQVTHVRGHPPGLVLALWWLREAGLGGRAWYAAIAIVVGSVAGVAALAALRNVAGEPSARRAAPFLVLTPAAIWLVVSSDAVYAGLGAIGCALVVVASAHRGTRADLTAAGGGLVLGAALFTSYGLVLLGLIPLVVCVARRRVRTLVAAGLGALVVGLGFAAYGFSWVDGLAATRAEYASSVAAARPYAYFVFANLAAFAIICGPAVVAGLASLRDRRVWLLAGAGVAAVMLANLSGLSKGEVERIWLPFWPWVAVAACALRSRMRWWLGAQAVAAIAVQTVIRTPW